MILNLPRSLGDGLLLRFARPEDAQAVADFIAHIHSGDRLEPDESLREWTLDLFRGDHPTTGPGDFTVVVDESAGGRIVSSLCTISQTWTYAGIPFGVGRPELVGTSAAYRRRGLVLSGVPGIEAWNDSVVALLQFALELRSGERVLDVACGSGPHALRFARAGFHVVGLDIAPSLAAYCQRQAGMAGLGDRAAFCAGDMRTLPFHSAFDAGWLYAGSFGFFGPPDDVHVLEGIARALKPGGRFVMDCLDPERARSRAGRNSESRPEGTYETDSRYDPASRTMITEFWFTDREGTLHRSAVPEAQRLYELEEMVELCEAAGLEVAAVYGSDQPPYRRYGPEHRQDLLIVARKEAQ